MVDLLAMNNGSDALSVVNISKSFGDFIAVDDLSFDIAQGKVFGFLGPNGAGKTTTIRMIVGITAPDKGTVSLFGKPITPEIQNRIGYLPEERGLYKKMKIVDQLRYFAALKDVPSKDINRQIDRWLDRMKLSEWKNKKTTDLSKGMQQKIQFIAAVIHDPDLLILDEPFSGLDPINVEFMIDVVAELQNRNKTIIFSTHLMETAERLCTDILLINKSRKVLSGSLREVKEGFGKKYVAVRMKGGERVLLDPTVVTAVKKNSDDFYRLELPAATAPHTLLQKLVMSGALIDSFEKIEPSLNEIFIAKVSGQ